MGKKTTYSFGDPEYLKHKFDDISEATYSEKSKVAKEVKVLVGNLSTDKDHMRCYKVLKTSGKCCGEATSGYVAHIIMGLNGLGNDSDYAAALKHLLDTGRFLVFDVHIDAADDLWNFLVRIKK